MTLTNEQIDAMYDKAKNMMDNAYVVYSNFPVGACVMLKSGEMIGGCNIENSSYGLTNCAERTALFDTYKQGYRKDDIAGLVVIANTKRPA